WSAGSMRKADPTGFVFVTIAVLALTAARLVAAALVPLSPDEAYYFDWSRHLSWGYYDHPPMIAWWIAASTALFGQSAFGVRALAVLSALPVSAAIAMTGRALFDDGRIAGRGALWTNATLLIGVGGFIATPDEPSLMFWTLAVMAFAFVVRGKHGAWWLVVGLCAGLGVDSKLTNLFLGLGIVLALVAVRDLRRWLWSPWTWAGLVVALAVVAPVALWNADHGWVTLGQFARIDHGGLQPAKLPEFIVTQFGLLNPLVAIFVGLAVAVWLARRQQYPLAGIGVLAWTALTLVVYLLFHSLHQQVQGNWPAPIYPTLALMAAAAAGAAPERWAGLRALVFPVGALLTLAGLVLTANPGNLLPFAIDAGRQLRGWDAVAARAEAFAALNGAQWIGTDGYDLNAELKWHASGGRPVIAIAGRSRYVYLPAPDPALAGTPGLVIGSDAGRILRCFPGASPMIDITRQSGRNIIATYAVFAVPNAPPAAFTAGCDRFGTG
ncbi:MAG TPA: glycosyltransferase family 39 protein, partial [Bauldia sp.]|nr:glycosyltransferase family 39 protein [Bauldia sp.]